MINFLKSLFRKKEKEFVLTRAKEEIKAPSPAVRMEEMTLKLIEGLFEEALRDFPTFINGGVILDALFDRVGYKAHAAFSVSETSDPIFISIEIPDLILCENGEWRYSILEKFREKMKEAI